MFSYYGSKSKIVHLYPEPKCDRIIEPFAGSARYSLKYWEKDVLLVDLSEHVFEVWNYLIEASEKDVRALPDVPSKVHLDNYKLLSTAERYLIGFHLCRGKAKPRKVGHGQNSWNRDRERIATNLYKIKHWKIVRASYYEIANSEATYFIDPPYKMSQERPGNGDRYPFGSLDYDNLAEWIRGRRGQVIACEGDRAKYLPFKLLATTNANTNNSTVKKNRELIYTA
ncbi:MAG: DNA adenine methylase [Pyrinomonadaceae bacterium]